MLELITQAAQRIAPYVKRTPLEYSKSLSQELGFSVYVKFELFQLTGAFKIRGAFNKLLSMPDEERRLGVVAVSGGNHAQAVALASRTLGVDAVIVMPENTPQIYVDATRGYGATVDLQPSIAEAFAKVEHYRADGRVFVHPFDDPLVMAGQGTVGLEIVEDLPDVTDVIVSIGGGGLAGGVASALKGSDPSIRIWGVETVGADAMAQALAAGHPVQLDAITSIAKTLGAPAVSETTLALVQEHFESVTVVTDADTVRAMNFILERLKVITEPAAACTLAAAEELSGNFGPTSKVVLIFCGGNTSASDLCGYQTLVS
ncbi:MAG TPA: threonine/serine dehydratase [Pyrinomonadaceae bacterium]|mgnify:CR=1 FL=1|nr:threonine/serine dehydratase [Chloracidobacterium sp.]MBP9934835.1 threonine/serine dehydratase [Pyrinomonadaceae bacterium]MBK7803135.1 threonine/serine dehydratase [Chloracidobacterium sp.]MBK9438218.1 threonine/serine dehydratase [Chloracidobacterium sp.]MBK9767627.1 threonine/serine dehydratase [Chloracidobacterium sp.]